MEERQFRKVSDSQVVLRELMIPAYENFSGKVHGGIVLSLMDKVAYACASSHSKSYCVTASVDSVDFLNSVEVGELLTLYSSVNYTGKTSMEIGIRVISENFTTGTVKHTNTSYFTMVALDKSTKLPKRIPGLILSDGQETRRFIEGKARRKIKENTRKNVDNKKQEESLFIESGSLCLENCKVVSLAS